jgi:hypothetical protein
MEKEGGEDRGNWLDRPQEGRDSRAKRVQGMGARRQGDKLQSGQDHEGGGGYMNPTNWQGHQQDEM